MQGAMQTDPLVSEAAADRAHVHLDAVGGVAGDMFVAAMLDARPALKARVFQDLHAVLPAAVGRAALTPGFSGGMAVLRFGLEAHAPVGGHDDSAAHPHHDAGHGARYAELVQRIEGAPLHEGTAAQAIAILRRLAEVESRLHGTAVDQVHFHEIGDWDSLMDVVAAGSIAAALDGWHWSVSELPRGHGLVRTQHGWLPVPAPATTELLRGFRWRDDGISGERVTPTGAAILAHLVDSPSPPAAGLVLSATGMGAGTREIPGQPNILRALVFDVAVASACIEHDQVAVIDFDVDDMTGEEIGVAMDRLRAVAGVIDVTAGTRLGKKGRMAQDLRLLTRPAALASAVAACFAQTSTLGLRWRLESRAILPRAVDDRCVAGSVLHRKLARRPDGCVTVKVESDDVADQPTLAARRLLRQRGENTNGEDS